MTHDNATEHQCHLVGRGECIGKQCMAWGWLSMANLCHVSRIKINGDKYCNEEPSKGDIPPVESFHRPQGEGWIAGVPQIKKNKIYGFIFVLNWERDKDPNQQGFCQLISSAGVINQLEHISDCLNEIQSAIVDLN